MNGKGSTPSLPRVALSCIKSWFWPCEVLPGTQGLHLGSSLVAALGLRSGGARARELSVPHPGVEPASPARGGRRFTAGSPGKSRQHLHFSWSHWLTLANGVWAEVPRGVFMPGHRVPACLSRSLLPAGSALGGGAWRKSKGRCPGESSASLFWAGNRHLPCPRTHMLGFPCFLTIIVGQPIRHFPNLFNTRTIIRIFIVVLDIALETRLDIKTLFPHSFNSHPSDLDVYLEKLGLQSLAALCVMQSIPVDFEKPRRPQPCESWEGGKGEAISPLRDAFCTYWRGEGALTCWSHLKLWLVREHQLSSGWCLEASPGGSFAATVDPRCYFLPWYSLSATLLPLVRLHMRHYPRAAAPQFIISLPNFLKMQLSSMLFLKLVNC